MTNKKYFIKYEVNEYIIDTNDNTGDLIPLEWQRVNGRKYRNIYIAAQKWLAVPAVEQR